MPSIDRFMYAGASVEGYQYWDGTLRPETIAYRNNNPGNLRSWDGYPRQNGFALFPNDVTGWSKLRTQIKTNIGRKLTLYEFYAGTANAHVNDPYDVDPFGPVDRQGTTPTMYYGYAPKKDGNDPIRYASDVAAYLNISPNVPLSLYQWEDSGQSPPLGARGKGDTTPSGSGGGTTTTPGGSTPIPGTGTGTQTPTATGNQQLYTGFGSEFDAALTSAWGILQTPVPGIGIPAWQPALGILALALIVRR